MSAIRSAVPYQAREPISGNVNQDVLIGGSGTTSDLVAGNYIGLDLAGTTVLTTSGSGGGIVVLTPGNTIGGTAAAARNVVANDASAGVFFQSSSATGNLIEGNYFGTNASGTLHGRRAPHRDGPGGAGRNYPRKRLRDPCDKAGGLQHWIANPCVHGSVSGLLW